jgi:hypothetical protein
MTEESKEGKTSSLSQTSKIALIVWGPIVAIILVYGGAFAVAKGAEHRYNVGFHKCMVDYNADKTDGFACGQDQTEVAKGPLWLPVFKVNGQISSGKY